MAPAFEHHAELPSAGLAGFEITVFAGSLAGVQSPATVFSPVVGAQLDAGRDTPEDIIDAARDWRQGERFGQVAGYHGAPLPAPPLDGVRLGGSGIRPRAVP